MRRRAPTATWEAERGWTSGLWSQGDIKDIAERAGVSKGAVSYALNGRPGVSDETRARILRIADELGWRPNSAARSLSASRANACGLVLARPARTLAVEAFFPEFLAGVESELSARSIALTLQLASDVEAEPRSTGAGGRSDEWTASWSSTSGSWIRASRSFVQLGLPAVVVGGPVAEGMLPAVWHDERAAVIEAHPLSRGARSHADRPCGGRPRVRPLDHSHGGVPGGDERSRARGRKCSRPTTRPRAAPGPPASCSRSAHRRRRSSIDSDVLAVTGLGVAQQMGFSVPEDLSIVAWDDSLLCQVVHPPLTTVTRDISEYGALACKHLLAVIDGDGTTRDVETPRGELTPRASTGPAPMAVRPAVGRAHGASGPGPRGPLRRRLPCTPACRRAEST